MAPVVQLVTASGSSTRLFSSAQVALECSGSSQCTAFSIISCQQRLFGVQRVESQRYRECGFGAHRLILERHPARGGRFCSRAGPPGNDLEKEKAKSPGVKDKDWKGSIEEIEQTLAKAFGGPVWWTVLLVSLAVFGGGYVYLIINYADFSDIPILNGPRRY